MRLLVSCVLAWLLFTYPIRLLYRGGQSITYVHESTPRQHRVILCSLGDSISESLLSSQYELPSARRPRYRSIATRGLALPLLKSTPNYLCPAVSPARRNKLLYCNRCLKQNSSMISSLLAVSLSPRVLPFHMILSRSSAGGASGCVVAGRLAAADPSLKILVVEAGPHTRDDVMHTQPARYLTHLRPGSTTVKFNVGKESPHLGGRSAVVPCGQCLGGGSSVNCTWAQ